MPGFAALSLIFLVAAVVVAFITKKNTGLIAVSFALILGRLSGIGDQTIIKGFNSSLFIMLLGLNYLFAVAQNNGTMECMARRIVNRCGKRVHLLPPVVFLLGAALSAAGPGPVSVSGLMGALCISLSVELDISPIKLAPFGALGAFAGGLSPVTPSGVIAISLANENGIPEITRPLLISMLFAMACFALLLYFPIFKWHKWSGKETANRKEALPFRRIQIITLVGILATIVTTLVFEVQIGLSSMLFAVIISLFEKKEETTDVSDVPISTIIMICGVGILIELLRVLGGIDLLSGFLSSHLNATICAPIMTVLSGVMSWVSSASGVVMPTLIPTVPGIAASLPGVDPRVITVCICIGAHAAALSPLSSCGAMILSSYTSIAKAGEAARNRMFLQLFAISACGILLSALFALLGCYAWFC